MIIIFATFLCFSTFLGDCAPPVINPDDLNYKGDPIKFLCVYNTDQEEFYGTTSDDIGSKLELMACLDNGKGVSLYFPGITSTVQAKGPDFQNAKEWFEASNTNICYITYAYVGKSSKNTTSLMKKMADTRRVEFVAREARDFVKKLRRDCAQSGSVSTLLQLAKIKVVGHSFGAHIASLFCKYLANNDIPMDKTLIGLDPADTSSYLNRNIIFSNSNAEYVQAIFTTEYNPNKSVKGHNDVYIKNECSQRIKTEDLIVDIHTAICQKDVVAIATLNGTGSIVPHENTVVLRYDEVLVGVYGERCVIDNGKVFKLTVTCNSLENLRQAMKLHVPVTSNDPKFKIKPIIFSCVHSNRQEQFHRAQSDNIGSKLELIGCLNNGKGLSLYFPELTSTVEPNGTDFRNAKEWFEASDTNICYITNAHLVPASQKSPSRIKRMTDAILKKSDKMADTRRIEFIAREAEDFVMKIKNDCIKNGADDSLKSLKKVIVVGQNSGAYIGSLACKYLAQTNREKVDKLIGLDPTDISSSSVTFTKEYARYVQVISTSMHTPAMGHYDVYIKNECSSQIKSEDLIAKIHAASTRKQLIAIATFNGTGSMYNQFDQLELAVPKSNEVLVGVYSDFHENDHGKTFTLSVTCDKLGRLKQALNH